MNPKKDVTIGVSVELSYEITNGMTGMQRNTILQLFRLMWKDVENVKAIVGMSKDHYNWIKHPCFPDFKYKFIKVSGYVLTFNCRPSHYKSHATFLLDETIPEGVFQLTIKIKYAVKVKSSSFGLGATFYENPIEGSSFHFWKSDGKESSAMTGVNYDFSCLECRTTVPDHSLVTLEINLQSNGWGTLHWLVNKTCSVERGIGFRPTPYLRLGVCVREASFTPIAFVRQKARTPSLKSISTLDAGSWRAWDD